MRRPSVYTDVREGLDVKMTPMIDVVFLLLIFFVWTAGFQAVEYMLPSNVSAAVEAAGGDDREPPPPESDFDRVVIRILWIEGDVAWRMNAAAVPSLAELKQRLTTIADIKRDAPVVLHPDPSVPLGHVIDVYDISRVAGFEKVQLAATGPT